jgi:D-proline reductase (dithiol) PrdB
VGLVARAVERVGIPTVTLSVVRSMTDALPAPRNVFVRFRLGQVLGEPGHVAQQQVVLRDALRAVDRLVQTGGVIDLPYRWKRDTYPPSVGITAGATAQPGGGT